MKIRPHLRRFLPHHHSFDHHRSRPPHPCRCCLPWINVENMQGQEYENRVFGNTGIQPSVETKNTFTNVNVVPNLRAFPTMGDIRRAVTFNLLERHLSYFSMRVNSTITDYRCRSTLPRMHQWYLALVSTPFLSKLAPSGVRNEGAPNGQRGFSPHNTRLLFVHTLKTVYSFSRTET